MLPRSTLSVALSIVAALCCPPPANATTLEDTIDHLRTEIGRRNYRAVADTIAPFVEQARASEDSLSLARLTCLQGQAALGIGEVDRSLELLGRARTLAIAQRDTLTWMTTMGVGAFALGRQGKYEEAIQLSTRQAELARATRDTISEGFCELSIGFAELQLGHPDRARPAYRRAIECFGQGRTSNWHLTAMVGLARVETVSGDAEAARTLYGKILERSRAIGDRRNEIDALNNLAELEFRAARIDLAVEYLRMAHEVLTQMDEDPGLRVVVLGNLVRRSELVGGNEAILTELDALRGIVLENGDGDAYTAATLALARARRGQGRYRAAAALFEDALQHATTAAARHVAALGFVQCSMRWSAPGGLLALLDAEFRAGPDATDPLFIEYGATRVELELAAGAHELAIRTAERFMASEGTGDDKVRLYSDYSRALARAGKPVEAVTALENAVALIEGRSDQMEDPAWKWMVVNSHHMRVVDAAAELMLGAGDAYADRVFALLQRLKSRTLIEQLRWSGEVTAGLTTPLSRSVVQDELLGPGELVLDYFAGQDHFLVFAIDSHRFRAHVLPGATHEIERDALTGIERIVPGPGDSPMPIGMVQPAANRMSDHLLTPVFDMIEAAQRVTVSPDGILASVPFGLLAIEANRPLLESRPLEYLPCLALRTVSRREPEHPGGLVTLVGREPSTEGARREVRELAGTVHVSRQIEGLVSPWPAEFQRAEVLHIAAHADVSADRPWLAGFHLEAGGTDPETGLLQPTHLRARDLLDERLAARLAVLSACESGIGRLAHGEGVIGISSAFLMAGCESVVSTLWPVDDAVTVDLMVYLYESLADGHAVADALRQAQLRVRANEETAHPYYWAGFVVIGDGAVAPELRRRRAITPEAGIFGALASLLLLGSGIWFWQRRKISGSV